MGKAKSTRSPNPWNIMLDTPGLQTKDRASRRVTEIGADDVPHRKGSAGASAAGGPGDHRRAATGRGDHAAAGLSWRRLLIASALVLLLPGALAILADPPPRAGVAAGADRDQLRRLAPGAGHRVACPTGPKPNSIPSDREAGRSRVARPGDNRYCGSGRAAHSRPHPADGALYPRGTAPTRAGRLHRYRRRYRRRAAADRKPAGARWVRG